VSLLPTRLEEVSLEHINGLVSASAREDQHLDYKQDLPDLDGKNGDKAKRGLLADVAAFANTGGGDVVFGIEERRDADGKPNGVASRLTGVEAVNLDALERRWTQIIEAGLDPRVIPKVRIQSIPLESGRSVVFLRVPQSITAPHMLKDHGWFYARRGPQNLPLSVGELRAAMEVSETWAERIRKFRDERIARIIADETPISIGAKDLYILHVVPLAPASTRARVDVSGFRGAEPLEVASSYGPRFNTDGLAVVADARNGVGNAYTQFFRDGSVEVVTFAASVAREGQFFPSRSEALTVDALRRYLPLLERAGVTGPLVVMLALAGLRGLRPVSPDRFARIEDIPPADRDLYVLPDFVLTEGVANLDEHLRSIFDMVWQCFGFERSPNFDAGGRWIDRR
jgi:hypothetical protein